MNLSQHVKQHMFFEKTAILYSSASIIEDGGTKVVGVGI